MYLISLFVSNFSYSKQKSTYTCCLCEVHSVLEEKSCRYRQLFGSERTVTVPPPATVWQWPHGHCATTSNSLAVSARSLCHHQQLFGSERTVTVPPPATLSSVQQFRCQCARALINRTYPELVWECVWGEIHSSDGFNYSHGQPLFLGLTQLWARLNSTLVT